MQGATEIALTKIDVLSCFEKIPVCMRYDINGTLTDHFPSGAALNAAKPVYEYMEGWGTDISGCRKFSDLPAAAQRYVEFIEDSVKCPITYVSVGADRDAYIKR